MASLISISTFTPLLFLYLLILPLVCPIDVTYLLKPYPDLSDFNSLLTTTAVAADISARSSITILAVPNPYLHNASAEYRASSSTNLADVLRYHILLEYLTLSDFALIPPTGKLVPTLFQTTGRAVENSGTVNITFDSATGTVKFQSPTTNATLLSSIETLPYNISIVSLNSLLIPYSVDLMASETQPPLGLNITKALIDGHNFNVAASMLAASGVVSEFEAAEGGAGITLFVPTDEAFVDLPSTVKFQSLTADQKAIILRFHVLHSYYPLGSLEKIVNPVYPTLATEQNGAGSFTVNISRVNGSVAIDTGIVQASITRTVFDQNPVAIYGVSRVLLPKEFFGGNSNANDGGLVAAASPPSSSLSPQNSPEMYGPSSHLSAPPGLELSSPAATVTVGWLRVFLGLWSIGIYLQLL